MACGTGTECSIRYIANYSTSGKIEYIATDATDQNIPWVRKTNIDGSATDFIATGASVPTDGQTRVMDCIGCHNRAAHSFNTAEGALDKSMAQGSPNASLPFLHKEGLALLNAKYDSQGEAKAHIFSVLITFYRSQYPAVWILSVHRSRLLPIRSWISTRTMSSRRCTFAGERIRTTSATPTPQGASVATMEITPASRA